MQVSSHVISKKNEKMLHFDFQILVPSPISLNQQYKNTHDQIFQQAAMAQSVSAAFSIGTTSRGPRFDSDEIEPS